MKKIILMTLTVCLIFLCPIKSLAQESKKTNEGVFEIRNSKGELIAVYTPNNNEKEDSKVIPRYAVSISWTVAAKQSSYGENKYNLSNGSSISTNISINPTGNSSTIGLYDWDNNEYIFSATGTKTDKFEGTITIIRTGYYSLAIRNNTNNTLTYRGTYNL